MRRRAGHDVSLRQLIAQVAKTRNVRGSIVGRVRSANPGVTKGTGDKARTDWPKGYSCIAEKRAMEMLQDGTTSTPYALWRHHPHRDEGRRRTQRVWGY